VVVNYNRPDKLAAALTSIFSQSVPAEVIVVDNGSLQRISAGTGVILIENDRNVGFARAVNQGIARASGEFIALLNNDAVADPLWLEQMLRCMRSPAVGMVASKILVAANPSIIDKAGQLMYPDGQNRGRGSGEIDRGQYDREEEVLWPDGCAALYRRSMLEEIGGFDETFFAYGEDAELGLRARIAGWRCVYAPGAVVFHERAATLGLASVRRVSLIERNRVLLAVKHFPARLLLLNPFYYAARLVAGAIAAASGRGEASLFSSKLTLAAALLRGDMEALPRIPGMLWKRWRGTWPRRLNASQICDLIRRNRISLRALSTEVARG
jgi:GT2 family glycosyltransferase